MPVPLKRILPRWQLNFRREYYDGLLSEVLIPLSRFILSIETDSNTELTFAHLPRLQNEVNRLFNLFFVGRAGRPFIDGIPQSSYAIALSRAYANVIYEVLLAHQVWADTKLPKEFLRRWRAMQKRPLPIQHPDSLAQDIRTKASRLKAGQVAEYKQNMRLPVAEIGEDDNILRIFSPNPQADIDPLRRWVDMPLPRLYIDRDNTVQSYRLSDAIWKSSEHARNDINRLVEGGIAQGMSAVELSDELERHLLPNARNWRTFMPYEDAVFNRGLEADALKFEANNDSTVARIIRQSNVEDFSFAAMRVARTEISRGFNNASFTAAYNNPFVTGYDWALANTHPRVDVCDAFATLDGSGGRIREAMTMQGAAIPPAHPHCLCTGLPYLPDNSGELHRRLDVIEQQMKDVETGILLPRMNSSIDAVSSLINDLLHQAFMQFLPIDIPIDRNMTRTIIPF